MLHYALQPATGLLFLTITHPDMPQVLAQSRRCSASPLNLPYISLISPPYLPHISQSAAFGFLEAFKNEIARHPTFSHLLRTKVRPSAGGY